MEIFLLSFLIVSLAVLGLAVGVIAGRQPIRAGCGGLGGAEGVVRECEICGSPTTGVCKP